MLKNNFAKNFGTLLKQKRLSQGDFGKVVGKGRSVIGSYIRAEAEPDFKTLIKIADYFGQSLDDLMYGVSNKTETKEYMVAEDPLEYGITKKLDALKEIFGGGLNESISSKLDLMIENQVKILERFDRELIKDIIKGNRDKISVKDEQDQN